MKKTDFIVALGNVKPPPGAAEALARASENVCKKKTKRKTAVKLTAALCVCAALAAAAAVFAGVFRRAHTGQTDTTAEQTRGPSTETAVSPVDPADFTPDCEIAPLYAGYPAYDLFLDTVKASYVGENGLIVVSKKGGDVLSESFNVTKSGALSSVLMTLYACTDYGEFVYGDESSEYFSDYSSGFEPVIISTSAAAGTFEYLFVLDLKTAPDGSVYSKSGLIGKYENDRYVLDHRILAEQNARMFKIRFERGTPVIYDVKTVNLLRAVTDDYGYSLTGAAGDRILITDVNDMLRDYITRDTAPADYPFTFSADPMMKRGEMCRLINELDLQWFIPLYDFESAGGAGTIRHVIGAGIVSRDFTLTSALVSYIKPMVGEGPFYTYGGRVGYTAPVYYAPESYDRPFLRADSGDLFKTLIHVEINGDSFAYTDISRDDAYALLTDAGFKPDTEDTYETTIPYFTDGYGYSPVREPYSESAAALCVNPEELPGMSDLFIKLGLKIRAFEKASDELPRSVYVSGKINVFSAKDGIITKVRDSQYDQIKVRGYIKQDGFTCSVFGYINGIVFSGDKRLKTTGSQSDEFLIVKDGEGYVLSICAKPSYTDLTGLLSDARLPCGLYPGNIKKMIRAVSGDLIIDIASKGEDEAELTMLRRSEFGRAIFAYDVRVRFDRFGNMLTEGDGFSYLVSGGTPEEADTYKILITNDTTAIPAYSAYEYYIISGGI